MAISFSDASDQKRFPPVENSASLEAVTAGLKQAISAARGERANALVAPKESQGDAKLENILRPQNLAEYIGQSALKQNLHIALEAAKRREEPMDHVLLYGPPGLGKTSLAKVLANEMKAPFYLTAAPALERPRDIIGILMALEPGTVLFIDEIHRLNRLAEEMLYPAMEDFRLDQTVGKGGSTRTLKIPLPKFTLIGATTKAGAISSPLRDRFGLLFRLNFYEEAELSQILTRSARILDIELSPSGAMAMACRCRGTPRIANRLLKRVRDYVIVHSPNVKEIEAPLVEEALAFFEIDPLGLDQTDKQMLTLLIQTFQGGPVGIETLAAAMGEDGRTLEEVVEPYLLQTGLISRTPRGRVATAKTFTHLGFPVPRRDLFSQLKLDEMEL